MQSQCVANAAQPIRAQRGAMSHIKDCRQRGSGRAKEQLIRQVKAVSDSQLSQQVLRISRVFFNLLPDLIDEDVEVREFITVVRSPDRLQQLRVRDRDVGMRDEIVKQVKLLRREPDVFTGDTYMTDLGVDLDVAEADNCGRIARKIG